MASPMKSSKQTVDLASGEVRVSRIRRQPPPIAKPVKERDPRAYDSFVVSVGISSFAVALFIIYLGFMAYYK